MPWGGQRNEPAFIRHVITRMAEAYDASEEDICTQTTRNALRVFRL